MIGLPLACAVLFLLNPPWWTEPITGIVRFFQSNLTRGRTIPIPVQFLGIVYQTPNQSLPWYNTLVWTVLVTPVGLLLLGLAGMIRSIRRHRAEPLGLLILGNWGLLVALRALPHTPGHDGARLFLPAFGVMALLVGIGARQVLDWFGPWARIAVAAAVLEAIGSVLLLLPVPLSYYSPLVGGLPGATRLGMEPTYYWDGLSSEARQWLRNNTLPGQTIHFASFPTSWLYLRQTGELPRRLDPIDRGQPAWYVMQNRPGAWSRIDRQLAERSTPALVVSKFGVPLIWVFPYAAYADVEKELLKPAAEGLRQCGRTRESCHSRPTSITQCMLSRPRMAGASNHQGRQIREDRFSAEPKLGGTSKRRVLSSRPEPSKRPSHKERQARRKRPSCGSQA
jgi:hypothetical protein